MQQLAKSEVGVLRLPTLSLTCAVLRAGSLWIPDTLLMSSGRNIGREKCRKIQIFFVCNNYRYFSNLLLKCSIMKWPVCEDKNTRPAFEDSLFSSKPGIFNIQNYQSGESTPAQGSVQGPSTARTGLRGRPGFYLPLLISSFNSLPGLK